MYKLLETINAPGDLKKLSPDELVKLADEIRRFLLDTVSKTGGHLASNLGAVELTMALHYCFDSPRDKFVWDVGHQAYTHKILTGRRDRFHTQRQYQGISGFPKRAESPHDAFDAGHASTSISAGLGMATARDLAGVDSKVIAIIGDGSLTGGMAFEALNQAGHLRKNLIVIVNDNEMSISKNVGAFSTFISRKLTGNRLRELKHEMKGLLQSIPAVGNNVLSFARKAENSLKGFLTPGTLFEALGFEYIGPIQGHDLPQMIEIFENVRSMEGPVMIHVVTTKGKGYTPAEENPDRFHGVGPFDVVTGRLSSGKGTSCSYTAIFGDTLLKLAAEDPKIVAITAAMPDGTGLSPFAKAYPERFFDVGIAEQHALTFAAGLAAEGFRPVAAVYSSFTQRAYDQVFHDICLQKLPVTLALDRAGLVGDDGPTHHGVFDLSYLRHLPEMTVMAPKDENELQHMIKTAVYAGKPVACRYPRGNGYGIPLDTELRELPIGVGELLEEGEDLVIVAVGITVYPAVEASRTLKERGISAAVINARFVKPLDRDLILNWARRTGCVLTVEENALQGGFGTAVLELLEEERLFNVAAKRLGIPDRFIEQGPQAQLRRDLGLDAEGIATAAEALVTRRGAGTAQLALVK
ncbi:1-deoxy-D-xylulose-5-phosphate synthase [Geobacter sp. DSM 9736]|uniref:1-deoxy-D-xylulose-5-phosphate synthase n=1 Tax=Geobacter sp. DSM 9736 TaxID=1277350 RepID=UPI000B50F185|nr:1-deoxy-D-xylulose-5-phosphate synthase [Geobacter sp. DSM 9736]SNB46522.1 1-deoxy-D-xylulose-5-phosphate synthase [Geobacter sp. DSM 9736]